MSATVLEPPQRRHRRIKPAREYDYLYDPALIVTDAKDYAKVSFKAALGMCQRSIQPVFKSMFSDLRNYPRQRTVLYPNCRLPAHMDTSYESYQQKMCHSRSAPSPQPVGRDLYKFSTRPKKVMKVNCTTPEFHPPTPRAPSADRRPKTRGTQTKYRESSAQTTPWQPDAFPSKTCKETPEVMYLDKLVWGPGNPYRTGELPADFHTTEIINKMRHARVWTQLTEAGKFPRWMSKRNAIITDLETNDWIFREAEIDELQSIRLHLLHKLGEQCGSEKENRTSTMLSKRWEEKKGEMQSKIYQIHRAKDREIRKLERRHQSGGRLGAAEAYRATRGMGNTAKAVLHRSYQPRNKHTHITYNTEYLLLEDHEALSELPDWIKRGGVTDLKRTPSGHNLPPKTNQLCERETKWSDEFLEKLHQDLVKARLGAAKVQAGPLHVMKPRKLVETPRPKTPEVDSVPDSEELQHQMALVLQRLIRGRAVQYLMYEGRTRAAELTEELKSTHGLQKEDKIRIAREEAKARDFNAHRRQIEKKEDAVTALVDELCGSAVSSALDFLEKELRRLKEERRQHAYILIALRDKQMREAAEAGRRQKEEHRRQEHDEMFKQVVGVTQGTIEEYLQRVISEGVALSAEQEAVRRAQAQADIMEEEDKYCNSLSTAEQNELIAELVHQFLLPEAHKAAAQHHIEQMQKAQLEAIRKSIFGLIEDEESILCEQCGSHRGDSCHCRVCPGTHEPVETTSRLDPRWKKAARQSPEIEKDIGERYPAEYDFRCMLNTLVDEAVVIVRERRKERERVFWELKEEIKENIEMQLEAKCLGELALDLATEAFVPPLKETDPHYWSIYIREDALARTEEPNKPPYPKELPSTIRQRQQEEEKTKLGTKCACVDHELAPTSKVGSADLPDDSHQGHMLPSQLRMLEELRKCKCDRMSKEDSQTALATDSTDQGASSPATTVPFDGHSSPGAQPEDSTPMNSPVSSAMHTDDETTDD